GSRAASTHWRGVTCRGSRPSRAPKRHSTKTAISCCVVPIMARRYAAPWRPRWQRRRGLTRQPERRCCEPAMKDFWASCGHHLLERDQCGRLQATDEFIKLYLARPELAPLADACVVERTLHAALLS